MTDEHGNVFYGSRFELSDDFRDGFIDSVQVLTDDKTRFSSPRIERSTGDITVLQNGAYTACEPCKDHPERPPFWQVRATKIIENQQTHTIYYENAQLLFWGFPVFWFPYFSSPDGTVNKQTGLLAPSIVSGNNLGAGFSMPYFINLAPNYDLTLTPTYLSRQGLLGEVDWRQRTENGIYNIRATGIDQQQPDAFPGLSLRRGRIPRARIDRIGRQLPTQRHVAVRLERHMDERQILPQRLPASGHQLRQFLFPGRDLIDLSARTVGAEFLRPQRLPFRGHDRERRQSHAAGRRAPVLDYNRVINLPADRSLRDRRRADDRQQRRQHRPDQRGFPVDRPADLRQRLSPLQRLRDASRHRLREHLFSGQMLAARHRRRLHARDADSSPGSAPTSIRSARSGSRSCSAASTARRPNSTKPDRSPTRAPSA